MRAVVGISMQDLTAEIATIEEHVLNLDESTLKRKERLKKQLKKYTNDLNVNFDKIIKAAESFIELETTSTTQEGLQKIAKKGKSYLVALRAMGDYSRFAKEKLEAFKEIQLDELPSYNDLKNYVRDLGKILSQINKKRAATDKVLLLHFAIKKRSINTPLKKCMDIQEQLNGFLQNEYRLIKLIEDVKRNWKEITTQQKKKTDLERELAKQVSNRESIKKKLSDMENKLAELEANSDIKVHYDLLVKIKQKEIELGEKINFIRKICKKVVSSAEKGHLSTSFDVLSSARNYAKNPVEALLNEHEDFSGLLYMIKNIIELVDSKKFEVKPSEYQRLRSFLNNVPAKVRKLREELLQLHQQLSSLEKDTSYVTLVKQHSHLKEELENLQQQQKNVEQQIEHLKKEIESINSIITQRIKKIEENLSEIQQFK